MVLEKRLRDAGHCDPKRSNPTKRVHITRLLRPSEASQ